MLYAVSIHFLVFYGGMKKKKKLITLLYEIASGFHTV